MEDAKESQWTGLEPGRGFGTGRARAVFHVAVALAAGLALRVWMLAKFFAVSGDSLVYGGLAKNLLLHGRYALSLPSGEMYPTLIRLPGYPLLLALCFRLFGMENYFSAACVQVALDLLSCLLLADFARLIAPAHSNPSAAFSALWLAALCPFTASYAAIPLTETATICMLSLAMWAMARFRRQPSWNNALCFTFAVTYAALLRPDGALAAVAFAPALFAGLPRGEGPGRIQGRKLAVMTVVCAALALAPFGAWAARNWRVFHVFEALAPRSATDPGDSPNPGWQRWVKTWCLDFASTSQIYWNVEGDKLDVSELPSRAFDSSAQFAETAALAAKYNSNGYGLTPEIDAGFARLAEERIAAHPLRYYVWLPLGRLADMALRPRVENLPIDLDWWVYAHHHAETEFSWAYAGLNAVYLLLGLAGLCLRPRFWAALAAYMALRSALLLTIEAPETRYTLECFPMLIAAGAVAITEGRNRWICKPAMDKDSAQY
jgi:hypothetical protein